MKPRWIFAAIGLTMIASFLAPSAAAHPSAAPVEVGSQRCYYYDEHETNTREFWIETNGVLTGGVPQAQEWFGLPSIDGPGSGLQREATFVNGRTVFADAQVDVSTWIGLCLAA